MPADAAGPRGPRRPPLRRPGLVALVLLLALTAFSWWLSGRWLARP